MDLVDDQCIGRKYVSILEPAARDPGRDHDHVPARRLRRRLALAIHDPGFQNIGAEDRLGDRANGESLSGTRAGDDSESLPSCCELAGFPWPCCFSRIVGIRRPSASSIVSQAARVGAMTISRPVGGSAATNASRSGGRYLSVTVRCIRRGKCIHRTGCETAPGILLARGRRYVKRDRQSLY